LFQRDVISAASLILQHSSFSLFFDLLLLQFFNIDEVL